MQFPVSDAPQRKRLALHLNRWPAERWLAIAALCTFVAEAMHLVILPLQYEIFFGYGIFFVLAAMAQGSVSVLLFFAPRRRTLRWATRLNAFLAGSYLITHTLGVLTGIGFTRLTVDVPGVVATLAEVIAVAALVVARHIAAQDHA